MATPSKYRIDEDIHDVLMNSASLGPQPPTLKGMKLPEPIFPRYPERLADPGPEAPPERRNWRPSQVYRNVKGWLLPYIRSRALPGDFHPIIAYLFTDYKCNLDCWYCWAYNNRVKGMTEDTARQSIDQLYGQGCRVLALMGGEPLLRPQFVRKVVYYAAKKGFWIYVATNCRLLRPELADRLNDAGVAVYNIAIDAWDEKPGLPKALLPVQPQLEYLLRKQYVYGYMTFLNINICRNNTDDVRQLTEYAHAHRIATDYHINETPMLKQDDHFKHLSDNPTYIRPEDWRQTDELIDWLVAKCETGYQMVNSVRRLREMKAFVRMACGGAALRQLGWNADGAAASVQPAQMPGIVQESDDELHFAAWNCRAGKNNVIVRTDGTVAPCFPTYSSSFDWGNIDQPRFDRVQLDTMKKTCQKHCFSTLNHNLAFCYDDARVMKFIWNEVVKNRMKGGSHSLDG